MATTMLIFLLALTAVKATNNSVNCTDVDWAEINTTNTTELSQVFQQCISQFLLYEACPDPSLCLQDAPGDANIGLAFGLTIGAGLATTIGALISFIPFIRQTQTNYLAAALGLAAGVMIYVSFTEIIYKSRSYLCCATELHFDLISSVCFFVGIIITVLLDLLVSGLSRIDCGFSFSNCNGRCCSIKLRGGTSRSISNDVQPPPDLPLDDNNVIETDMGDPPPLTNGNVIHPSDEGTLLESTNNSDSAFDRTSVPSSSHSPILHTDLSMPDNDLPNDRRSISGGSNAVSMTTNNIGEASIQDLLSNTSIHRMHVVAETASNYIENVSHVSISLMNENEDGFSLNPSLRTQSIPNGDVHSRISGPSLQRRASYEEMLEQQQEVMAQEEEEETPTDQFREVTDILGTNVNRLKRMGILTGLAIALHNFPEGLATFVATLSDPAFGGALALAIALHNIPEGICVSMPVYYATGSRIKAFLWAFLSGVSEPLGALLGWLILQNLFGPIVYGISFGMISGMMVYISLKELLPTAHKFDKTNGILTTVFLVIGMVIMSLSLVLFAYR